MAGILQAVRYTLMQTTMGAANKAHEFPRLAKPQLCWRIANYQ